MELLADPSLAVPRLPPSAELGSDAGARALPLPPPPPQRGSVMPAPEPLQQLFPGSGKGASGLLQQLLGRALERLEVSCSLAAGLPDGDGQQLPLRVSPDIDFGTVAVSRLESEQLLQAAASVAAGLPASAGATAPGHAAAAAGSMLDLLHLSSRQHRPPRQAGSLPPGSAAPAAGGAADAAAGSVLHFRQLVVENTSTDGALWLLGGIAAPAFNHTLAAVDDARLFWLEGGRPGGEGCA